MFPIDPDRSEAPRPKYTPAPKYSEIAQYENTTVLS